MTTDVKEFLSDLDAGVFEQQLSKMISEVAGAVLDHNQMGKVSIILEMKRIGTSAQVMINEKLVYVRPTSKGKISEEYTTETPMYVGRRGKVSLFPEDQGQLFDKEGNIK